MDARFWAEAIGIILSRAFDVLAGHVGETDMGSLAPSRRLASASGETTNEIKLSGRLVSTILAWEVYFA